MIFTLIGRKGKSIKSTLNKKKWNKRRRKLILARQTKKRNWGR